jgi:hypothetical protein
MRVVERVPKRLSAEGLMLLPVEENTYRRVGFFNTLSWVVFDNTKSSRVIIV